MAIPYIPGSLSFIFLQRWINDAHQVLIDRVTGKLAAETMHHRNVELRKNVVSVLTTNSMSVMKDYLWFLHDLANFSMNSIFSMLVIAYLLPSSLLLGYCLSLFLSAFVVIFLKKLVSQLARNNEAAYISYSNVLGRSWDNLTVSNEHNRRIWSAQKHSHGNLFYSMSNKLQCVKQIGNLLVALVSLGPTLFIIYSVILDASVDFAIVAALFVNFTRIFLIINSLSYLVYQILDWSSMRSRLKLIFDIEDEISSPHQTFDPMFDKIRINGENPIHMDSIASQLKSAGRGRFTVTGENGAGKSTILLLLKNLFGDKGFLYCATAADLMWYAETTNLSSGERASAVIKEALSLQQIDVFLLDEWDAHLDVNGKKTLDELLDVLSVTKTVVEVRH
jgi:ABC-type bacteriocin/lantibiotic exporter with double-glycine peptidase domain